MEEEEEVEEQEGAEAQAERTLSFLSEIRHAGRR